MSHNVNMKACLYGASLLNVLVFIDLIWNVGTDTMTKNNSFVQILIATMYMINAIYSVVFTCINMNTTKKAHEVNIVLGQLVLSIINIVQYLIIGQNEYLKSTCGTALIGAVVLSGIYLIAIIVYLIVLYIARKCCTSNYREVELAHPEVASDIA